MGEKVFFYEPEPGSEAGKFFFLDSGVTCRDEFRVGGSEDSSGDPEYSFTVTATDHESNPSGVVRVNGEFEVDLVEPGISESFATDQKGRPVPWRK